MAVLSGIGKQGSNFELAIPTVQVPWERRRGKRDVGVAYVLL